MDGLVLSLALIVASAAAPAASLKFHCDGAESANAIYHLACLAGHIPCTQDVFERFWHDTLQWTAADQRELDAWIAGLGKVERAAGSPQAAPYFSQPCITKTRSPTKTTKYFDQKRFVCFVTFPSS